MVVPERRLDEVAPEESRAADYQYVHPCLPELEATNNGAYLPAAITLSP
jgi:hypothetical protein